MQDFEPCRHNPMKNQPWADTQWLRRPKKWPKLFSWSYRSEKKLGPIFSGDIM